jgi:hypothetical protein
MSSGKKNYFRHSIYASKDDKIVDLISKHGKQAYFHYFRLIELCAEQAIDSMPEKFIFHRRTLCAELLVTNSRLGHHLLAIQSSLLCHYFMTSSKVEILIPNLPKYLGLYQSKNTSNFPIKGNKIKENKIKLNTSIKPSSEDFDAPQLNSELTKTVKKKETQSEENKMLAKAIRENYISGYQNRYGVKPTWAAKENSLVKTLITRVGQEALELSANYLNYNDPWHIQQKHPFGLLVSQLDKIRVELNNPNRMLDHHQAKKQLEKYSDQSQLKNEREKAMQAFLNKQDEIEND